MSLEDALSKHNNYVENERDMIKSEIITKGHNVFYNKLEKTLEEKGFEPNTKTSERSDDVRSALTSALLEYFDTTEKYISDSAKKMMKKGVKEKKIFDYLADEYDKMNGAMVDNQYKSIRVLYEVAKHDKTTTAQLKNLFKKLEGRHAETAMKSIDNKKFKFHFGHLHKKDWMNYITPRIEKAGLEVSREYEFNTMDDNHLYSLTRALEKGEWGEQGYDSFNLREKKKKVA